MASSDEFPFDFEVYIGKEALSDSGELIGERVVKRFIEQIDHSNEHCIYTDNLFTSANLLSLIKKSHTSQWYCATEPNQKMFSDL